MIFVQKNFEIILILVCFIWKLKLNTYLCPPLKKAGYIFRK